MASDPYAEKIQYRAKIIRLHFRYSLLIQRINFFRCDNLHLQQEGPQQV